MLRIPHCPELTELMDEPDVDRAALAENLRDLREFNRIFGWTRSVLDAVARIVRHEGLRQFRLLDVATGSGDVPLAVLGWAARRGLRPTLVGSDIHPATLRIAARHTCGSGLELVRHDALAAPFKAGSFDIVTCNLSLHHFPPEPAVHLLRELGRVGRYVVVSDLERSRAAYWGALVVAHLLRHSLTSHDGPVSVRRAYTSEEAQWLAARAGLRVTARRVFPFRIVLTGSAVGASL